MENIFCVGKNLNTFKFQVASYIAQPVYDENSWRSWFEDKIQQHDYELWKFRTEEEFWVTWSWSKEIYIETKTCWKFYQTQILKLKNLMITNSISAWKCLTQICVISNFWKFCKNTWN